MVKPVIKCVTMLGLLCTQSVLFAQTQRAVSTPRSIIHLNNYMDCMGQQAETNRSYNSASKICKKFKPKSSELPEKSKKTFDKHIKTMFESGELKELVSSKKNKIARNKSSTSLVRKEKHGKSEAENEAENIDQSNLVNSHLYFDCVKKQPTFSQSLEASIAACDNEKQNLKHDLGEQYADEIYASLNTLLQTFHEKAANKEGNE